jgi:hypothetical protein
MFELDYSCSLFCYFLRQSDKSLFSNHRRRTAVVAAGQDQSNAAYGQEAVMMKAIMVQSDNLYLPS